MDVSDKELMFTSTDGSLTLLNIITGNKNVIVHHSHMVMLIHTKIQVDSQVYILLSIRDNKYSLRLFKTCPAFYLYDLYDYS